MGLLKPEHLDEIAERAWLNVAGHSTRYRPLDILASLADLDGLAAGSVDHLANVQYLLSLEVKTFLSAAAQVLRRLAQTTDFEIHESRVPVGVVNWPATLQRRLAPGSDGVGFVLRRNEVHRDLPENRLLKGLLVDVSERAARLLNDRQGASAWRDEVSHSLREATRLARSPLLEFVPPQITANGARAARSSRAPGYREVAKLHKFRRALFGEGDREVLLGLFRQAVLLPNKEARRFELLLLFRLLAHLEARGAKRRGLRLVGLGDGPVFEYELAGTRIEVYFQGMPKRLADRSLYATMTFASALGRSLRRPDIIVRTTNKSGAERLVLLEAKCSASEDTIRDGLFQLLGYSGDLKLELEVSPKLAVAAFEASRYPGWPSPFPVSGFLGTVTDLEGFSTSLDALKLLTVEQGGNQL